MVDVLIVYDSKSGHTESAARRIYDGVMESGATVKITSVDDVTLDDVRQAKGVILGSFSVVDNYSGKLREFINDKLKIAKPDEKIGAAFGTYKWSGDNIKRLENDLHWLGLQLVSDGVNVHHPIDEAADKKLVALGKKVGEEALKL